MKKILALVAVLALLQPPVARAEMSNYVIMIAYDPSDTSNYTYCKASDEFPISQGVLSDVAASTTVTGTGGPFTGLAANDILYFRDSGQAIVRKVATWTNANSITVNSAITITGVNTALRVRKLTCGTGTESGWMDVGDRDRTVVQWDLTTLGSASMTLRVQGRIGSGAPTTLLTTSALTATASNMYVITEAVSQIRVGLLVGAADATDANSIFVRASTYAR